MKASWFVGILTIVLVLSQFDGAHAQSVEERIAQLEQELAVFKRQLELKGEEEAKQKKEAPVVTASARDGFSVKSSDGNFRLRIRGLLQADGRYFTDNRESLGYNDTFVVRRARPIFEGTVARDFDFYLMPDFGSGSAQLVDAYLEYKYFPEAKIRAGKFKLPFALERLQSDAVANFIELGLTGNLGPNRDVGVQLSGDVLNNTLHYAVGYFNGGTDAGSLDADNNNEKDVVGRIFAHPFINSDVKFLKGLGVGIAGSYGIKEGTTLPNYRSAGQASIFQYATGTTADGGQVRLSPQLYYYYRSLGLLGEYVSSEQDLQRNNGLIDGKFKNEAWQISGIYVLTGEDASYRGVNPKKSFDLKEGNWGAFAVTGRYGELDVDDAIFDNGFASLNNRVSEAKAWGTGLTWFLNRNLRATLNYERTSFEGGAASGADRPTESVVFSRFQVAY